MKILLGSAVVVLSAFVAPTITITQAAPTLPAKDSTAAFGSNYGLGYSGGKLYLLTGNSIYVLDGDPRESSSHFVRHMTGLESAFVGPRRVYEGTFATSANGTALVSMGFTDGGVLLVDLTAKTSRVVPDFDGDGRDNDNILSAVGRDDGTFFAMWSSRQFFPVDATKVYSINPDTLGTSLVADINPGEFTGGMAFDPRGNLVAGTFAPDFSDPANGAVNYFRINADALDQPDPDVTHLGSGLANGNLVTTIDRAGNIFFNTTTGIGLLRKGASDIENFYGDINDPTILGTRSLILEGLTYDRTRNSVVFAQKVGPGFELRVLEVPEPTAGLVLIVAGVGILTLRRVSQV